VENEGERKIKRKEKIIKRHHIKIIVTPNFLDLLIIFPLVRHFEMKTF